MRHIIRVSTAIVFVLALTRMGMGQELQFEELGKLWGGNMQDIVAADSNIMFATSQYELHSSPNVTYLSTDKGDHWSKIDFPDKRQNRLYAKAFRNGSILVIWYDSSWHRNFLISDDIGATWTPISIFSNTITTTDIRMEQMQNGKVLVKGYGAVYRCSENFDAIENITPPYPVVPGTASENETVWDFTVAESGAVYLAIGSSILKSVDNGDTWNSISDFFDYPNTTPVCAVNLTTHKSNLYIVQRNAKVYDTYAMVSTDEGHSWDILGDTLIFPARYQLSVDDEEVLLFNRERIHSYHLKGSIWEHQSFSNYRSAPSGICALDGNLYAAADYGIMKSDLSASNWTYSHIGISEYRYRSFHPNGDTLYRGLDQTGARYVDLNYVDLNNDAVLFSMSTDGGQTWEIDGKLGNAFISQTKVTPAAGIWASPNSVYLYQSWYDDESLVVYNTLSNKASSIKLPGRINEIAYLQRQGKLICITLTGIYIYDQDGDTLRPINSPPSFHAQSINGSRWGYKGWIQNRIYAAHPERTIIGGWFDNAGQPSRRLYEFDPDTEDFTLYCEYDTRFNDGGIVNSRGDIFSWASSSMDTARSWWSYPLNTDELVTSMEVDDNDIAYIGTTERLLYSTNGGVTWEDSGFPYPVRQLFLTPDGILYVDANNNGLYKTTPNLQYVVSAPEVEAAPSGIALAQNYPNPVASGSTTIAFNVAQQSEVTVTLYNALGARVAEMFSGTVAPGNRTFSFNTSSLAPGMYRYVLHTPSGVQSRWMTVIR